MTNTTSPPTRTYRFQAVIPPPALFLGPFVPFALVGKGVYFLVPNISPTGGLCVRARSSGVDCRVEYELDMDVELDVVAIDSVRSVSTSGLDDRVMNLF